MDLDRLMRLKGAVEASQSADTKLGARGLVDSYSRIRGEVAEAVDDDLAEELDRLFPEEPISGGTWTGQAEEAKTLLSQMAGWLGGMIESAILDRRIQAEAEAKAKRMGFQ